MVHIALLWKKAEARDIIARVVFHSLEKGRRSLCCVVLRVGLGVCEVSIVVTQFM